jgi:hypothetical protein
MHYSNGLRCMRYDIFIEIFGSFQQITGIKISSVRNTTSVYLHGEHDENIGKNLYARGVFAHPVERA